MPHFPNWFVAICILLPIANAKCRVYESLLERLRWSIAFHSAIFQFADHK